MKKNYDVLILGGGPAGLSAALAIGRMARTALVCDDGRPRNASSQHLNNFPSQDGVHPADWKIKVKKDLHKYNTIEIENKTVKTLQKEDGFFEAVVGEEVITFKKIILAHGIEEQLPTISGIRELWGKSVLHCSYCHGYEVQNKKLGLILDSNMAINTLPSIYGLSKDLIVFTNGFEIDSLLREKIHKKEISIIETKIKSLTFEEDLLKGIVLDDDRIVVREKLFLSPQTPFLMKSPLGESLGCEKNEFGIYKVSPKNETSVSGVFACGDIMGMAQTTLLAAATGNLAGAGAVGALLSEEFDI